MKYKLFYILETLIILCILSISGVFTACVEYRDISTMDNTYTPNPPGVAIFARCADNHLLKIVNNNTAKDVPYNDLVSFIVNVDKTDEIPYEINAFVCADYAETVHNNAEAVGVKAGVVLLETSIGPHAINVFNTTDKGLVFIDDTWHDTYVENLTIEGLYSLNYMNGSERDSSELVTVEWYKIYW